MPHFFFKRGGLLIGWIQVLVSAPSVTPANFTKEASYCAHVHRRFFFWVRFLNEYENQAGTVAHFLGFMNLGLAFSLDHARFTPIDT